MPQTKLDTQKKRCDATNVATLVQRAWLFLDEMAGQMNLSKYGEGVDYLVAVFHFSKKQIPEYLMEPDQYNKKSKVLVTHYDIPYQKLIYSNYAELIHLHLKGLRSSLQQFHSMLPNFNFQELVDDLSKESLQGVV